jgi:hypothetical protein
MLSRFWWTTFDVTEFLPQDWQRDVMAVAADADVREFPRTPVLTREAEDVSSVRRGRVHADQVQRGLPWLRGLYRGPFLDLANQASTEKPVLTATDERYGVVLNVQRGSSMRFECHVDSNPVTGLLFFTEHEKGGELVVGHDKSAQSVEGIEKNHSVIRPQAGHLAFIDGRKHPHYARPLVHDDDVRVLAVMNYYTQSCPESTRPPELNSHLYGDPLAASAPTR